MFGVIPAVLHSRLAVEAGLWVDPVAGVDATGDGTKLLPYKTLAKAFTLAPAGSTINCKSGTFNEQNLASATNSLTIRAGSGFSPVFSNGTQYATGVWVLQSGTTYQATSGNQALLSAWHGETRLQVMTSIATVNAQANSAWIDTVGLKLYVNVSAAPTQIVYECHSGQSFFATVGTACTVQNCTFKWCDAASVGTTNWTYTSCTFKHIGFVAAIYMTGGTSLAVAGCTFTDAAPGSGFNWISPYANGITVTVSGSSFSGGHWGVDCPNANTVLNVTDCTFTGMSADGINQRTTAGSVVTLLRCTFVDCVHGAVRVGDAASSMVASFCIAYNVVQKTPGYGFIVDGPASGVFDNCTAYNCGSNGFFCNGASAVATVRNCISASGGGWGIGNTGGTLTEDHNCLFGNLNGTVQGGAAASDITTNPTFVNAPTDLHLQAGSPCLDAGVAFAPYTNGAANYDMGRYSRGLA